MVSVIIPAFNAAAFLAEAVGSVLSQSVEDWELIIVDDGSTDGLTPRLADTLAAADSRVRAMHTPNRGVSAARNAGMAAARGEWLAFLDADDALRGDALQLMLEAAGKSGAEIVCAAQLSFRGDIPQPGVAAAGMTVLSPDEAIEGILYQRRGPDCSACGKLFDRRLAATEPFSEGIRYEDLDWFYRVFSLARRVAWLDAPLYFYRSNPGSFTHTWTEARADVLDVCDRLCAWAALRGEAMLAAASDRRLSAAFNVYGLLAANPGSATERTQTAGRCLGIIRRQRRKSLLNPRVRLKNKLGILISYAGGPWLLRRLSRIVYGTGRDQNSVKQSGSSEATEGRR